MAHLPPIDAYSMYYLKEFPEHFDGGTVILPISHMRELTPTEFSKFLTVMQHEKGKDETETKIVQL